MGIAQFLRGVDARLTRYAEGQKAGVGYPNPGWAPPAGWAGQSVGGVTINDETARTVAAWYAGIRVISEDVASLPLILYRRQGRSKDRATDLPLYRLLHDQPNPEMTSFVFREVMQSHVLSWGNAYAEKEVNGAGRTLALWPLRPDRMEVTWENGRRRYDYRPNATAAAIRIPTDRIFHIPGLGFDGLVGYSVLRMARETLGQAIALREYGARVVANDARPGIGLQHPATLSKTARENLEDSWNKAASEKGAGRVVLVEEGITIKEFGFPPEDIQFLESQQWQVTEVARWLRLAPHKIGDLTRATFSNIEEQNIDHVTSTIRPWLVRWEQQLSKDVVQDPSLFAEHLLDGLLRGDSVTRATAANIQFRAGVLLGDEWRAMENRNPLPDDLGASPMVSADMQSMTELNASRKVEQDIELVKAGLLTENEARAEMGRSPIEWSEDLTPEENAVLIEQVKAGLRTENEARALLKLPPIEWSDDLTPEENATLLEQVKAGVRTENEVRELLKLPPMQWAEGPSQDDIASLVAQVKEGLLTIEEARAALGRPPVEWPDDLSEKVTQAATLVKAGFDPADVLATLGLPPIRHLGLPPSSLQKPADAVPAAEALP